MNNTISQQPIAVYPDDELKKHFFQIPNLIYDIQGLKSHERDVYCFLTRVGNQGKACFMTNKNMAKKLSMSERKLEGIKNTLSSPFPELDNEPLIFITHRKKPGTKENLPSEIRINGYIWKVSFKKSLGVHEVHGGGAPGAPNSLRSSQYGRGVAHNMRQGGASGAGKEYYSKNTKDLSEDRSKVVATAPPLSLLSFGEFKRVKLTQQDYDDLEKRFGKQKLASLITGVDGNLEEKGLTRKNYKAAILNWERREKIFNPKAKKEDTQEKNKTYAEEVVKTLRKKGMAPDIKVELCRSYLEIGAHNHPQKTILNYSENGFRSQLDNQLRKMNLTKYLT